MSSPKSPFGKLSLTRPKPLRLLVLGQHGVGKSALVVRYLTRRFIGEYDPTLERIYPFATCVDGESLCLEILDSAALSHETDCIRLEANIRWADVFLLLYSVTDKCSFDDCNRLKFLINYNKRKRKISSPTNKEGWWDAPVLLVGNKKDISEDRMISTEEGFKRSQDIGCVSFHEISVRESIDEATKVFTDAIKYWKDFSKIPKIRRTSSELTEAVLGIREMAKGFLGSPVGISNHTIIAEMNACLKVGRKGSQEESRSVMPAQKDPNRVPYRGRASTDGWLHQRRSRNLRMNLCLRSSLLLQRRMSIAMKGD